MGVVLIQELILDFCQGGPQNSRIDADGRDHLLHDAKRKGSMSSLLLGAGRSAFWEITDGRKEAVPRDYNRHIKKAVPGGYNYISKSV